MGKIAEAWEFISEAKREFAQARREKDRILMRDAAEKGWNACIQALNYLFAKEGISPLPKSHRERRIKLRELEATSLKVKEKGIFDRFMARDHILHERAFYDGDVIEEEIEEELRKVEAFIKDIEEL